MGWRKPERLHHGPEEVEVVERVAVADEVRLAAHRARGQQVARRFDLAVHQVVDVGVVGERAAVADLRHVAAARALVDHAWEDQRLARAVDGARADRAGEQPAVAVRRERDLLAEDLRLRVEVAGVGGVGMCLVSVDHRLVEGHVVRAGVDEARDAGLARGAHQVLDAADVHRVAPFALLGGREAREVEHGRGMEDGVDAGARLAQGLAVRDVAHDVLVVGVVEPGGGHVEAADAEALAQQLRHQVPAEIAGGARHQAVTEIGRGPDVVALGLGQVERQCDVECPTFVRLRHRHPPSSSPSAGRARGSSASRRGERRRAS